MTDWRAHPVVRAGLLRAVAGVLVLAGLIAVLSGDDLGRQTAGIVLIATGVAVAAAAEVSRVTARRRVMDEDVLTR